MSPRAACRLEAFGFTQVYDYTAGIADWKAAGLAVEGDEAPGHRVADATRRDIPACTTAETVATAEERARAAGWDECVVVDCRDVVVGRLRGQAWDGDPASPAALVMEPGPTTVRPDQLLEPLVERMEQRGTRLVLVTTPQGALLGAVLREEAQRLVAGESPAQIWQECDGCPGRWAPATPS